MSNSRTLTNDSLRADRDAAAKRGLCPNCFGWGFPIMAFDGREAYNPSVRCPDCNGTGRPKSNADAD